LHNLEANRPVSSFFSWLDYSEREKRKMLDLVDLFAEQDTRDELGIGTVRDAIADLLFPGTSTIQRRARYFFFVPWLYLDLERRTISATGIADAARKKEIALIDVLAGSDDSEGTIGIRARKALKRPPSNVYWQGLGVWGIRLFPGSQDQYHRSFDDFYTNTAPKSNRRGEERVDEQTLRNWHAGIPPAPGDFPKSVSFTLTRIEADYLRERIMSRVPDTLLAFLVDRGRLAERVEFPWQHHQFTEFADHVREQLDHARNFSDVIHSAALLYNLMLAENAGSDELISYYQEELQHWLTDIRDHYRTLSEWDRRRFWEVATSGGAIIPPLTRMFVDNWLNLVLLSDLGNLVQSSHARSLIRGREIQLKRGLARLENRRALELWSGAAGAQKLNFRWPVTQTILTDILTGLSKR
jgi:hypothetical protein